MSTVNIISAVRIFDILWNRNQINFASGKTAKQKHFFYYKFATVVDNDALIIGPYNMVMTCLRFFISRRFSINVLLDKHINVPFLSCLITLFLSEYHDRA